MEEIIFNGRELKDSKIVTIYKCFIVREEYEIA